MALVLSQLLVNDKKMTTTSRNFLFFIVVAASAWYLNNNLLVVSNIEQFMPANIQNKNAQVLIDQSQKGLSANLILAQISGSNDKELSRLSRALKLNLEKKESFNFVINSQNFNNLKHEKLLKYRYLLHNNNTFDIGSLRHNFEKLLTAFTADTPSEFIDYLLIDPQSVFLDYLSLNQIKTTAKQKNGVWFVDNKALLMIQIQKNSTIEQQDLAIKTIKNTFEANKPSSAKLLLSGASIVAVEMRQNILNTIQYASFALIIIMFFVFVFIYRSIYLLLLAIITLASSVLISMSITQLVFSQIHGIVLAFGITALGVCLDYPLHVFSNTCTKVSARNAVKKILKPLRIGVLTSIFAYMALIGTGFDGLTQLAIFASIGLLSTLFISVYFLPLWMQNTKIDKRKIPIGKCLSLKSKIFMSLLVVLLPAIFLSQQVGLFNTDISQLNPASIASKKVDANLRQALGAEEIDHIFLASDKNLAKVLTKTQEIQQQLKILVTQDIIGGTMGADTLLPDRKTQKYRQEQLPNKEKLKNNVALALSKMPFKQDAFDNFINDISSSKTMPLLNYQDFKESFMADKLQSLLFVQDGVWYSLIRVIDIKNINKFKQQVNNSYLLKNTYYSISAMAGNIMNNYLKETWTRLFAMLLLLFAITLWFAYKNKNRIWIVLPVFSGVLISLSFQALLGNSINIFHLLSLLLVIGLGFDYSLFFNYENNKVIQLSNSTHAITISAITTIITFSVLAFSNVTVLSSIGQIVVIGVFACFIIAKFISTPTK